jgi:methionyl-tRNA formyltransferase
MKSDHTTFNCVLVAEADRFCLPVIEALTEIGINITEVWCEQPEKYEARNFWRSITSSKERKYRHSVTAELRKHDIKVSQVLKPYSQSLNQALALSGGFDFLICAGSNVIFPKEFLDNLEGKAFNLHPALLPSYRGPKPLHAMILHGTEDLYGGMTLHLLSRKIDAGDIIGQKKLPLKDSKHSDWASAVIDLSKPLIKEALIPFLNGEIDGYRQDEKLAIYYSNSDIPEFINSEMTFSEAEIFSKKAHLFTRNLIVEYDDSRGANCKARIYGVPIKVGSASSSPTIKTAFRLEMDLADCRVEFKVDHRLRRFLKKFSKKIKPNK